MASSVLPSPLSRVPSTCISQARKGQSQSDCLTAQHIISLSPLTVSFSEAVNLERVLMLFLRALNAVLQERKLQLDLAEKRTSVVRELLQSERKYVQMLEIVRDVYAKPLRAALSSNRAILSAANIQIIFSDILRILCLNR